MARDKRKRAIIVAAGIIAVVLIAIGTIALIKGLQPKETDPYKEADTSTSSDSTSNDEADTQENTSSDESETSSTETTIDPANIGTIDITPMNITVSYLKGISGFEYEVLRTPSGTQYAELRSPDLIGTKCTDDQGTFASILADPQSDESATLAKKTTVDGTTYGLSLATDTCTSDATTLKQYQDSFSSAFSLLKKSN